MHFKSYCLATSQLEEDEEITTDNLNPCTRRETSALGDPNMRNLKQGEIIQLERKGYYRCDVPFLRTAKPIVLFSIPDGRQQSAANK
jgi:glutamyl-tRNA synthetase